MGQGTTRVVDDAFTTGHVRALGDEITDVRRRLDALVMELDRRRHNVTDWKRHVRRHGGTIALGAAVVVVAVAAPMVYARMRSRRRVARSLIERGFEHGAELTDKARRLGQALGRIAQDPDRVAPPTTASVGSRAAVALAAMLTQALATTAVRALAKRGR